MIEKLPIVEFSEVEPAKFKQNAGKSYREVVNALIYPISVVRLFALQRRV